ncbi:hypothetical protein GCM10017056_02320 [Seohaeicola zhoushanensis]|uniref:Uncharacterized protein n=1 Tax=Seohaeicola zhoushanensis TaxID=1569283 RepID=A0A8J3M3N2_9RHOB|nr:hypothetical protein GCM10017056_02320 [Seohaeicola zhoushanensis]
MRATGVPLTLTLSPEGRGKWRHPDGAARVANVGASGGIIFKEKKQRGVA